MSEKRAVTAKQAESYRAARSRGERGRIIEGVMKHTGYSHHYAGWLLRNFGKSRLVGAGDGKPVRLVVGCHNRRRAVVRPRKYGEAVKKVLVHLWDCFDQMCGKRLVATVPALLPSLVKHKVVAKGDAVHGKLSQISAATVDRLLRAERAKRRLKGISHTKPSTALKNMIPIVISSELSRDEPGHYQIDLVGHDGGNPNGHFAFTLTAVELFSGWVELNPLLNKAHRWAKEAIKAVKTRSPVPLKDLHSDSDSAFINEPVQSWCLQQNPPIPYRRGRPYHSNDTCYVEQKNGNIVRGAVGYARYETEEELKLLGELYDNLRLLINFFYPSMKLLEKKRVNGRIRKLYDEPRTPVGRLLDCPAVSWQAKRRLRSQGSTLDPFVLKSRITRTQGQLLALVRRKNMQILYPGPSYPQATERMKAQLFPHRGGVSRHGRTRKDAL
jgi:hypothetical protein